MRVNKESECYMKEGQPGSQRTLTVGLPFYDQIREDWRMSSLADTPAGLAGVLAPSKL